MAFDPALANGIEVDIGILSIINKLGSISSDLKGLDIKLNRSLIYSLI